MVPVINQEGRYCIVSDVRRREIEERSSRHSIHLAFTKYIVANIATQHDYVVIIAITNKNIVKYPNIRLLSAAKMSYFLDILDLR